MRRGIQTKSSGRHKEKGKFLKSIQGRGNKCVQENEKISLYGLT